MAIDGVVEAAAEPNGAKLPPKKHQYNWAVAYEIKL